MDETIDNKELKSRFTEIAYNDKQDDDEPEINWKYWASLSNIKPRQAAKLAYHINPRTYPGNDYRYGVLPKALADKIDNLEQFLEGRAPTWALKDLVIVLDADFAPHGMVKAARAQALQQVELIEIQPLEHLTKEQMQEYSKRAAWSWVDAIYILQGYKPAYQLTKEQVHSHFPNDVEFFTKSIQLGNIGKEITQEGERTFIDSPAKWETFWQEKLKAEQQTEAGGDSGACSQVTAPISPKAIQNKTPRARKTNLSRAVDAAIKIFGSKPSFDELWQFFQDDKDETTFIQDYTDTHLTWIDTKGKLHDTQKETLANHLSRVRS